MLILQCLYFIACILFIISGAIFKVYPMIIVNICYLLVNIYQIVRLLADRSPTLIPYNLRSLYNNLFQDLRPREFLRFLQMGERGTAKINELLYRDGDYTDYMILIMEGEVAIEKNGTFIARLPHYYFLGEMRYLTGGAISANVRVVQDVVFIKWTYQIIAALKKKNPELFAKFYNILSKDLVNKLQVQQTYSGNGRVDSIL
jgi:CRP-like cAMP-binding protein